MTIRTRFAPSPTGYLHIGGARTALFAWLFARQQGGQFVLRIEDTDQERSTQESVDAIFTGMTWLGLDWDETPVYQTQRLDRYRQVAERLIEQGHAYRCYCSKERLEQLRTEQLANKLKPRYDGHCRHHVAQSIDATYVIRFKNPTEGKVTWQDLVYGELSIANSELDDLIIIRSDAMPTYNFAVVIDDWDMNMTHILRGDDHINNTPRQINLYHALGVPLPKFGHLPMILGSDGARLSKRHGAVSVTQYRDEGYLPEAMVNYLVRLGWAHGNQEIFSKQEMIDLFDITHISKSPATFNPEKLLWLNQHYLKTSPPDYVAGLLASHLKQRNIEVKSDMDLIAIVKALSERSKTVVDMVEQSRYFFQEVQGYDQEVVAKFFTPEIKPVLQQLRQRFGALSIWAQTDIHAVIQTVVADSGLKLGTIGPAIRIAITGGTQSPSLDLTLYLLGQPRVLTRLDKAIDSLA